MTDRTNSMIVSFALLYGCVDDPPPEPVEVVAPEPKPIFVEEVNPVSVGKQMYELGRQSVETDARLADAQKELDGMKKVVYMIACVERITGSAAKREKELERLARGRPSRVFAKCKKEMLKMTQSEIDEAVWDEEANTIKPVLGKP